MDYLGIRQEGVNLGLDLTPTYLSLTYQELIICVNGVGPEWFPEWARKRVTKWFEYFLPSTNQHDCDFSYLPKTEKCFREANERLLRNMNTQIRKDNSLTWWRFIMKWRRQAQAKFLHKMCVDYGESAFFNGKSYQNTDVIELSKYL